MKIETGHNITLRAVIIGLILILICIYWVMMTEVKWYVLQGTSIPLFVRPIVILFVLSIFNILIIPFSPINCAFL